MGLLGLLLLLLVCLSPSIPLVEAAGVLRQVVGGDDDGGTFFEPFNVTYDHRALILGGKRRMLVSAGLHYPRATPEVSSEVLWCFAGSGAAAVGRGSGAPRGELTLVVAAALIAGVLWSQFLVRAGRLGSAVAAVGRAFPITSEYVPFYS